MEQTDPIGAVIDRLCHTREELAHQLGVSPAALYSWSVGRRSPRPANRTELAKIARSHARELANLAALLEGPSRRPVETGFRNEVSRPGELLDKHRAWRDELRQVQARAVAVRMKAREGVEESRANQEVRSLARPAAVPNRPPLPRPVQPPARDPIRDLRRDPRPTG